MINNAGWNATIAAKGTAAFGFNGSPGNVGTDVPTDYTLNGVALGASTPPALSINNVTVNDGTTGATAAFTVCSVEGRDDGRHGRLRDGQWHGHGRHQLHRHIRHADLQPGNA